MWIKEGVEKHNTGPVGEGKKLALTLICVCMCVFVLRKSDFASSPGDIKKSGVFRQVIKNN